MAEGRGRTALEEGLARRWRVLRRRAGGVLLPVLGPSCLTALARSWRTERVGEAHLEGVARGRSHLLALWHGRMLLGLPTHRDRGYTVLVSPSDDGGLVLPLLFGNGYHVLRGSTHKRPERALREMLTVLEERGGGLVLTPDGPRGPRHSVNDGLAWISRETGHPIVPCGFVCDRAWRLSSWDRFTIPRPRARVALVYGEPLEPGGLGSSLRRTSRELKRRLLAAEALGFQRLGTEADW